METAQLYVNTDCSATSNNNYHAYPSSSEHMVGQENKKRDLTSTTQTDEEKWQRNKY